MVRKLPPRAASGVWIPVSSSAVSAVGRFGKNLGVRWLKSGKETQYRGAGHLLEDCLAAPSIGRFVNLDIKPYFAAW